MQRRDPFETSKDTPRAPRRSGWAIATVAAALVVVPAWLSLGQGPDFDSGFDPRAAADHNRTLLRQTPEQAHAKSRGCLSCHVGIEKAHASAAVKLGCVDCHGGDAAATPEPGADPGSTAYETAKTQAHVAPRFPERQGREGDPAANPERSYTALLAESPEFVRFVNPGDLRVAQESCGGCHQEQVDAVIRSPMTTSSIFWAAAAYANGILPEKRSVLGESYDREGQPRGLRSDSDRPGALAALDPLPRWHVVPPGEYFRAFEMGGLLQPAIFPEIGNPIPFDEPGRPDIRVSDRGPGTGQRISPAVINLHKTRLNDPHLSFLGTNDHPGDYRSSGCTACHLVYANDRDPVHSGPWAEYGHRGQGASGDPTLGDGSGHPIRHQLTRAIPTSQCMVCHMHQPNSFVNTYLGYTMWDYETDGEHLWPEEQRNPTLAERRASLDHNPEGAAARGLWTDREFLASVSELNPDLEHTQFADYHGHGWIFRAVFSRDRKGNLLDAEGQVVPFDDPERFDKAVHLRDIHLERGMHCVDCHFSQDVHGTGLLHGEYAEAIEIECQDCHGDVDGVTTLRTSGPAAPPGGHDLRQGLAAGGRARFQWKGEQLVQRSMLEPGREWTVPQVVHGITPGHPRYSEASAQAKSQRSFDGSLAHGSDTMTCYSCHSAWITACFGCHLPQEANQRSEVYHYEGETLRNYASYNPQVIRTDAYMLGKHGVGKEGKIAPVRSSSALVLSSINPNRQRIYIQQPPISSAGFSSQAFNPHVPHTVRTRETKTCVDCHLSSEGDNNAWMAQLLTQGTGYVNFVGRFAWVALGDHGLEAVAVTEWDEPQAVIGSSLHRLAYPENHHEHQAAGQELEEAEHHDGVDFFGKGTVLDLQLRGEYLYTALGPGGLRVLDVANIDNKDFSERIVTAPVSPLGQDTHVATRWATSVALPTTMPVARREPRPENLEQPLHPIYDYAIVSDREEGLVLVDVTTMTNGDPRDNFLERELAFDADGRLAGAETATVAGHHVYVGCDTGLAVVDLDDPSNPRLVATLGSLEGIRAVSIQFRYAFVVDHEGLAVVDITQPEAPRLATRLKIDDARGLYVARTWAYVAAGSQGLVVVDVEKPEQPRIDQVFDGDGRLHDAYDVVVGSTNASLFAYVANGEEGLVVLQLTSPDTVPGYLGFSPRPVPQWIAQRHTHGSAIALSRGLDRDRAVDEDGHQVSVFNRLGARPFTREEMERLYFRQGELYTVDPPSQETAERDVPTGDAPSGETPTRTAQTLTEPDADSSSGGTP